MHERTLRIRLAKSNMQLCKNAINCVGRVQIIQAFLGIHCLKNLSRKKNLPFIRNSNVRNWI